jgi:hypothetical protein
MSNVVCAQVRRDLKLLLGSNIAEVINAAFPVIACRKPANTILVPNRFVRLLTSSCCMLPPFNNLHFLFYDTPVSEVMSLKITSCWEHVVL